MRPALFHSSPFRNTATENTPNIGHPTIDTSKARALLHYIPFISRATKLDKPFARDLTTPIIT